MGECTPLTGKWEIPTHQQSEVEFVGCAHFEKHSSPFFSTASCTFWLAHVALIVFFFSTTSHEHLLALGLRQSPSVVVLYHCPPRRLTSLFQ